MKKREDKWIILNTFSLFIPIGWRWTKRLATTFSHYSLYSTSLPRKKKQNLMKSCVGTSFITASNIIWVKDIELGETLLTLYKNSRVDFIFNILPALERKIYQYQKAEKETHQGTCLNLTFLSHSIGIFSMYPYFYKNCI